MKFSVIIPVYNAENYIEKSIQSVLEQTCQDFEVILVNDGSTDSSKTKCDKLAREHSSKVRVFHQENQGQLLTRCNGIRVSKGEYCIFLDADDSLVLNGLEIIEKAIKRYQQPDMIIYSFYYDSLTSKRERAIPLFPEETIVEGEGQKRKLYEKFFTGTGLNNVWTKAVKRTVFDGDFPDYHQYAHIRCAEDRFHAMGMVTNANRIVYINEPLYVYKLIPNSITRTFSLESISRFNIKELYEEEFNYLKKWKLPLPEWKDRLDAGWVLQTWYIFDLYYNKIRNKTVRNQILRYEWCDFLPSKVVGKIECNSYLNKQQKKCWKWIIEKKYCLLQIFFMKKSIHSRFKKLRK